MIVILTFVIFVLGLIIGRVSRYQNSFHGNILIGTSALGALMFGGYTWYDESFLFGVIFSVFSQKHKLEFIKTIKENKFYSFFLLYFLFEFINGIIYFSKFDDNFLDITRKFRWFFFIFLLLFTLLLGKLKKVTIVELTTLQLVAILIFLMIYLVTNYVTFLKTGSPAFAQYAQDPTSGYLYAIWANTAYVSTTITILLAFGLLGSLKSNSRIKILMSYLVIIFCSIINGLTSSRSGYILSLLLVSFAFLPSIFGEKRVLRNLFSCFLLLLGTFVGLEASGEGNREAFYCDLTRMLSITCDVPSKGFLNPDRQDQYINSFFTLESSNNFNILFGYGLRTSGSVISRENNFDKEYATSFLPSFVIEFGLIGIFLVISMILNSVTGILSLKNKQPFLTLALLLSVLLTTVVVNNFDFIALYLLLGGSQSLKWLSTLEKSKLAFK